MRCEVPKSLGPSKLLGVRSIQVESASVHLTTLGTPSNDLVPLFLEAVLDEAFVRGAPFIHLTHPFQNAEDAAYRSACACSAPGFACDYAGYGTSSCAKCPTDEPLFGDIRVSIGLFDVLVCQRHTVIDISLHLSAGSFREFGVRVQVGRFGCCPRGHRATCGHHQEGERKQKASHTSSVDQIDIGR